MPSQSEQVPSLDLLRRKQEASLREYREVTTRIAELETGGGGGHSGDMDAWQQTVNTRLSNIETKVDRDFKVTWGGILLLAVLGLGLAAWLDTKVENLDIKLSAQYIQIMDRLPPKSP